MTKPEPPAEVLVEALRRLRPALTERARAIVSNYSDAEDVVQESAVRAWHARAKLRPGADPAPWLNAIVTRVAIDFSRKARRRETASLAKPSAQYLSLEDRVVQYETFALLSGAAARLTTGQRRLLFLHDYAGFTSHEIAHLDGVPYHTVRTRLRRARLDVRQHLEGVI